MKTKTVSKKKNNSLTFIIIFFIVVIGIASIVKLMLTSKPHVGTTKAKETKLKFTDPIDSSKLEESWVENLQADYKNNSSKTEAVSNKIKDIDRRTDTITEKEAERDKELEALKQELTLLKDKLNEKPQEVNVAKPNKLNSASTQSGTLFPGAPTSVNASSEQVATFVPPDLETIDLTPPPKEQPKNPPKTPDNYVPAGSHAQAISLGGAEAATGVGNTQNPNPMLFKIVSNGTLPNGFHSHLKGCTVTSAVIGDISSERDYPRLERLSCVKSDGSIIDVAVDGAVFDGSGLNGIKGTPVWREGPLLERSFVAGTLSGFADGIRDKFTTQSTSALGTTTTVGNGQIAQHGLANGVGNAMEKYADYNIKRAELYHPVIGAGAGIPVDIVFLKGFYINQGIKESKSTEDKDSGKSSANSLIQQFFKNSIGANHA